MMTNIIMRLAILGILLMRGVNVANTEALKTSKSSVSPNVSLRKGIKAVVSEDLTTTLTSTITPTLLTTTGKAEIAYNKTCFIGRSACITPNAKCQKTSDGHAKCLCKREDFVYVTDPDPQCFERPLPLPGILEIKNITETSFEVSWQVNSTYRFFQYYISISNISEGVRVNKGLCNETFQNSGNCTFARAKNLTSIVFDGLDPGVYYKVSMFTSILGVLSKKPIQNGTYTRPLKLSSVHFSNVSSTSFILKWTDDINQSYSDLSIVFNPIVQLKNELCSTNEDGNCTLKRNSATSIEAMNLKSGMQYTVSVYTIVGGLLSEGYTISTYTGPSAPHLIGVTHVFATNLTLLYNVSDDKYSYFRFNICNETCVQSYQSKRTFSKTIGNLSVATLYRIEVHTVIITTHGTLESENTTDNCISSFTAPKEPQATVNDDTIGSNSVQINLPKNDKLLFDYYKIIYYKDSIENTTKSNRTDEIVTISNLVPGTRYTFKVYTVLREVMSEKYANVTTYTRPSAPHLIEVKNVFATNFTLLYNVNDDKYSYFRFNICNETCEQSYQSNGIFSKTIGKLSVATLYRIEVYTVINTTNGPLVSENTTNNCISSFTAPKEPHASIIDDTIGSNSVQINLAQKDNLLFDYYKIIYYKDANENTTKSNRTDEIVTISDLVPGTRYTFKVYTVLREVISEKYANFSTYTRPSAPHSIAVRNVFATNFTLIYNVTDDNYNYFKFLICNQTCEQSYQTKGNLSKTIVNLTVATRYRIKVYTVINTIRGILESENTTFSNISSFTAPMEPNARLLENTIGTECIQIRLVNNNNLLFDYYKLTYSKNGEINTTKINRTEKIVTISDLVPGIRYTFKVYTVLKDVTSEKYANVTTYTRPRKLSRVHFSNVSSTRFILKWRDDSSQNYSDLSVVFNHIVKLSNEPCSTYKDKNCTMKRNSASFIEAMNLTSGKQYTVSVYAIAGGLLSEGVTISSYTVPLVPKNISVYQEKGRHNSLTVFLPTVQSQYHFNNWILEISSENYSNRTSISNNTQKVIFDYLEPGTKYKIVVRTQVPGFNSSRYNLSAYTRPSAPHSIEVQNVFARNLTLLYNISDDKYSYFRFNICNKTCVHSYQSNRTLSKTIGNLSVATLYRIEVYTVINTTNGTLESENTTINCISSFTAPKEPQASLLVDKIGFESVQISLANNRELLFDYYEITYNEGKEIKTYNRSGETKTIPNLLRGTFYTFKVYTVLRQVRSEKHADLPTYTRPAKVQKVTVSDTTQNTITITWSKPAEGESEKYNVVFMCKSPNKITNMPNKQTFNETTLTSTVKVDPGTKCNVSITTYIGRMSGDTIMIPLNRTSNEKEPDVAAISSLKPAKRSLKVNWSMPHNPNGIIRKYQVLVIDDNSSPTCIQALYTYSCSSSTCTNDKSKCQGIDFTNYEMCKNGTSFIKTDYFTLPKETNVTGLHPYRFYRLTVRAYSQCWGHFLWKRIRTKTAKPGKVSNLTLESEIDVTKQRSVYVIWNEPIDRNGIIQNYFIEVTNRRNASTCYVTDNSTMNCNYIGLFPGNYSVQVFANTSAGNGPVVMKTVYVQPGAPLRVNESVAHSADQPKDTERQMAVNLPLKTFLCNTSNGYPTKWGVIVAQNDQATDEPFFGSVRDFTDRISKVYKTWFDVKDMDSIKPYLATYLNLTDSCQQINGEVTQTEHSTVMSHNIYKSCKSCLCSKELLSLPGTQKKRSVTQRDVETYQRFVVGLDGKCSGQQTDRFCNGELQPGRSYRVKTFACTINGCTETKYSKPISTDPDLTVAVASGITSAIVVLAIVGVVVFVLRRKQLACFSKDDGRLVKNSPDEEIHLDKIEHTKKNPSSTPGQGPVKLNDFSDAVERFHRDSDLLFADAYKVLKEKSPSHPMTAAEQQCCRPKNRYTNILPFDHSRVKLRPSDDMEGSDYINANYIPGYKSRREYIATQGPMQATFDDFWRMVWEQNVDTIVMLTKLMEKGRRKCDKYWPDMGEPVFYGDLVVSLQSESNMSDYIIKIFEVKTKTQRKMVRHFSYLKWPDMGCPETPELLLEFVKAVKQYGNRGQESSNGPMIVHCSAGVGRTGTFIAVDYLLQHIKDHDEVDIFNLVLEMRNNRLNMVQTEDQYIYIHECIKSFITTQQEEEEQEDDDEAIYVNTGFGADEENLYANT